MAVPASSTYRRSIVAGSPALALMAFSCLRFRSDRLAAGDLDPLRIDPAAVLREQTRNHRPDVVGQTDAAERSHAGEHLVDLGIVAHGTAAEVGFDRSRRHRV